MIHRGLPFLCVMASLVSAQTVAHTTHIKYLSGTGSDNTVPWDFFCTDGMNSGVWSTIQVPSNWELQGFGTYNYGHDRPKASEQGRYRTEFSLPTDWQDRVVNLVFDGVMTDAEVWINGRSAGPIHQGGFYRFKHDITALLTPGINQLEVLVSKVSSERTVEQAERQSDYWVFGGIFRPVYLEALPRQHIDRVAVDPRANGDLQVDVFVRGEGQADRVEVAVEGTGLDRPTVMRQSLDIAAVQTTVKGTVPSPRPWTAETPHLYNMTVTLYAGDHPVHQVTERIGFRTFEVHPGEGLFLNGQKIQLKGVCRHAFWPDTGRCLNRQQSYADVQLMKDMNMNAVRMSHYPPDTHFLEACDELGLYVLDELAGWQRPSYSTGAGSKLLREMVTRDVNHACILFWDNANEGGWNRDLDKEFALLDPQNRTVLHPWENFNGVDTDHYENYNSTTRKLASGTLFMPTEFLHGLYDGGHGAGLEDYWGIMGSSPMGAGGFLWVFADEGVVRTDQDGRIDVAGNQAPDGILGPHHEKEASFYTIKEIWSPVQIPVKDLPEDFTGTLPVENLYHFTNLEQCRFRVQLVQYRSPWHLDQPNTMLHTRDISGPNVSPGQSGDLVLALPDTWKLADALRVTALDHAGRDIRTWTWPIQSRQAMTQTVTHAPNQGPLKVTSKDNRLVITTLSNEVMIDETTGMLAGIKTSQGPLSLDQGPRVIQGDSELKGLSTTQQAEAVVINATYSGALSHVQWQIQANGWIKLSYEYHLQGEHAVMGVQFNYPEKNMKAMTWLGQGPYRVYKNRLKGGQLNVWHNDYKDHQPGVTWDFPEFRGYYRDWYWVTFDTTEGRITLVNDTDDLHLGVYRPKDGPDPKNTALRTPDTQLALLHGIPAIGTKFLKAEALGPQGQANQAQGTYKGTVYIRVQSPESGVLSPESQVGRIRPTENSKLKTEN
ncbi:MAG: glycoside hydrolase family 2 [Phycisphaerae bacterium]|nr:glycoside hydrolase family 2 [Phycisphaerae bacterium]